MLSAIASLSEVASGVQVPGAAFLLILRSIELLSIPYPPFPVGLIDKISGEIQRSKILQGEYKKMLDRIVNVIDPQTSAQVSIIAQFQNIITLLIFLIIDAHYWFILSIAKSFELIPLLGFCFTDSLMESIIRLSCNMFDIAAKLAAPIIAALLFTSVALGLIARTVPQMNIFIVGFPLKIAIGLLGVGFSLPLLSYMLRNLFQEMGENIMVLLRLMA